MDKIRIERVVGADCKVAVDEFYRRNGSQGIARDEDLFFIATSADKMVGCVRFCVDEGTPMLRTMNVDSSVRQQGIGALLLQAFAEYLDANAVRGVFCLPYGHLIDFYGKIDFKVVAADEVPPFLIERSAAYAANGINTIFMRRA